ncbi:hypothetical protein F7D01_11640 [Erythrobacter sp. 3-20A1M]|uniref:PepSY domain-containing protein n=1 Tax=Erythrobacter sp. 3-20A1M TaxID=2653850 RepID=UPI001BFC5CB4|nr:PepSY domain-containing protein [Erythrobacter sp. 3-20A1M]QWC57645.1 hypothetical protein F7D01_11640 [Erythrobacter sp. 3-20A1M]
MKIVLPLSLVAALALTSVAPSFGAEPPSAQDEARKEMRAGNILPRRTLENAAFAAIGKPICRRRDESKADNCVEYLAGDYDSSAMAYRFKFIQDGHVIFVDVDARTGRVLRRSR